MLIGGRPLFTESSLSFTAFAVILIAAAAAELEGCVFFLVDVFDVIEAMDDDEDGDDA